VKIQIENISVGKMVIIHLTNTVKVYGEIVDENDIF